MERYETEGQRGAALTLPGLFDGQCEPGAVHLERSLVAQNAISVPAITRQNGAVSYTHLTLPTICSV
eukprot:1813088-Rhodomonas_salina.1